MMVSVERVADRHFHVLKHHGEFGEGVCAGHSMALLVGLGSTTFELGKDTNIFVTVEWREPVSST